MLMVVSAVVFFGLGFLLVFFALLICTKPFSKPKGYQLQNVEPKRPNIDAPDNRQQSVDGHSYSDDFIVK